MNTNMPFRRALVAVATLCAGCADHTASAPSRPVGIVSPTADRQNEEKPNPELEKALAKIRAATAKYHDIQVALNDGFALRHECGTQGDDGPIGTVYANRTRARDGVIDPSLPDGLIYEPTDEGLRLVGVELVIPYALWTDPEPPSFFGHTFQREDGFGVFGLHVWVWLNNPNGMFEETNPRVTC